MLTTTEYYTASEITYRQERIAQDWNAVRNRGARQRPSLGLLRRSTLRLPQRRLGSATLA
jgi:hypothetical protein